MRSETLSPSRPRYPLVLYPAVIFGLWTAYVATAYGTVRRAGPVLEPLANEAVRAAIFVLPVLLLLAAEGERRPWAWLKLTTHARRGVLWGAAAGAALLAVHAGLAAARPGASGVQPVPVQAYFTSLTVATLIEEVAFRGYLLQRLAQRIGRWPANVASAALFAGIHLPGWILVSRMPPAAMAVPLLEIFALGLALGFLLFRSGSLWAPFLLHAANNLAYILFYSG